MAGSGALNLSLLSRGVGEVQRNGHEKVEVFLEPEDYYNFRDAPDRFYFPPLRPKYALVADPAQLSSRESRENQEIHLPKTFTTRKGALLLFSEDLALKDSEREQAEHAGTVSQTTSTAIKLKTVEDLTKSILSYGNDENNTVYMKFLHRKREKLHRQIRPGFSAKRYLATWTRSWDDNILENVINKGYITDRSLFQYNFVVPHLRRRVFYEDLSHYPPPYRLMRNMLLSPGSLSGYTFYRAIPELEDMMDGYDRDVDRESMRSRPPTSIKVIRTRDGHQREVSYASLDKKSQEEVITDLLVKSAVHYALRKQQEYVHDELEEIEAANREPSISGSERKMSSSMKTPVKQFDMKEAVESLLSDTHRQLNLDADLPALDTQSHSSGGLKGSSTPAHLVKGHSAKTRSWPYGIDEAGKEYIGSAPIVQLRDGSSSPSGSVSSLPQLPAVRRHPLTPIKDVSRETTSHGNIQLPPIQGADGIPHVSVEPPTPQHSTLIRQQDEREAEHDVHVVPSEDENWEFKSNEKWRRKKGDSHHSSVESIPHSLVQSIPSKNRPHWKGSQQSLKSVGSKKGRVDFDKYSIGSPARSESGSAIGEGSLKGSIICAPDGEIISVGGSVGPKHGDVAPLHDVTHINKRIGVDGEVEESIASDGDEPEEWKESRRKVHAEGAGEIVEKKPTRKDGYDSTEEMDPTLSFHQWKYVSAEEGKQLSHSASITSLASSRRDSWERIAELPDEEARAMLDSRATNAVTPNMTTPHNATGKVANATEASIRTHVHSNQYLKENTDLTRESTRITEKTSEQELTMGRRERTDMTDDSEHGGHSGQTAGNGTSQLESVKESNTESKSAKNGNSNEDKNGDSSGQKENIAKDDSGIYLDINQTEVGSRSSRSRRSTIKSIGYSSLREDSLSVRREGSPQSTRSVRTNKTSARRRRSRSRTADGDKSSRSDRKLSGDSQLSLRNESVTSSPRIRLPKLKIQRSNSVMSATSGLSFDKSESSRNGLNRSKSQLSSRSSRSRRSKTDLQLPELNASRMSNRDGSVYNVDILSARSSIDQKLLSSRGEKLPPLNLSGRQSLEDLTNSLNNEELQLAQTSWTRDEGLESEDEDQGLETSLDRTFSRPPSQATGLASMGMSETSKQSLELQVTGFQMMSTASAPVSVRSMMTSRSTTSGVESSTSEQMLVDALTEHAQKIAQSVLRHSAAGSNLEADIRRAASLWTERHPGRDISRSQSVQEKPNTDAIEEIMRNQRINSADVTAADYRNEIQRNLTTAVAKRMGLAPDSLPADAEISPELLEALANQSLTPDDIEIFKDEESGRSTLRTKSQLSRAMGGVREGHLYVSPGGSDEPPVSIQSDRVTVKDVGDVDVISYGVPDTDEQRSKASSKTASVKDGEEPRGSRKPSGASQGPAVDDLAQAVKQLEEEEKKEDKTESPDDGASEKGSAVTGVSKLSQKSEDSKKSKGGKKKTVSLEDREEFVVGKVDDKKELEKLYGPVDPPPPPKPSPPKPSPEKKPAEIVVPPEEIPDPIEKTSPTEVDIPPEPGPISPPKKTPRPDIEAPVKSEPKKELPPLKKKPAPPAKEKSSVGLKRQTSNLQESQVREITEEIQQELSTELPAPAKPSAISVKPPEENATKEITLPPLADKGRVNTKDELAKLYSQLPPVPPKTKEAKGKPKNKAKAEKPVPPKKEKKTKEKKVKIKKEKKEEAPPPPPREPTPPPQPEPAKAQSPKHSPEPAESYAASPTKSEDMEFVFVRDRSVTPDVKDSPVPHDPTPPVMQPTVEEEDEEEDEQDEEDPGVKQISNKDARMAKRAAAAAKKREEVERRRREKEEEVRRQKEESERQDALRREMEEERKRRDEERRLRKLREEEERKKEEQLEKDREKRKMMELERERRAKEEYQRKLEEMRRKQAEEEERRLEALQEQQREEEERRLEEEEMLSKMAEQERKEYERRKREEEELRKQREEEEKRRREEEAQRALEEAKRLAEDMARRQAELQAKLRFNRDLQLEAHGLEHTQDITRMFVFSYFELLQWLGLDIPEFELQKLAQFS